MIRRLAMGLGLLILLTAFAGCVRLQNPTSGDAAICSTWIRLRGQDCVRDFQFQGYEWERPPTR